MNNRFTTAAFSASILVTFVFFTTAATGQGPVQGAAGAGLYKQAAGPSTVEAVETIVLHDGQRNKDLTVRVSYPREEGSYPLVVWSHGMYGSKDGYQPLVRHWVSHGYVVIQPTHSDSLSLVGPQERRKILAELTLDRVEDWMNRPRDVQFVLDSLDELAKQVPPLEKRMDRGHIGMGGHSFGAFTSQLVAGTTVRLPGGRRQSFTDPRPAAFVVISGNGAGPIFDEESFQTVKGPTLFVSGTNDKGRKGEPAEWRKDAYQHAAPGDKYLAWVDGASHDFGGISGAPAAFRTLAGQRMGAESPDHVDLVRSVTLAFWDSYLKQSNEARAVLQSDQLTTVNQATLKLERK